MTKLYSGKDVDKKALKKARIAILGYGSQGRAHALNLKDSGHDVVVGVRKNGDSWKKAQARTASRSPSPPTPSKGADLVAMLVPDLAQKDLYAPGEERRSKKGATLLFAHGFNIHFKQIKPRKDLDVVLIAPKGPGDLVRRQYQQGRGVPCLIAVYQDATGNAFAKALAYAHGIGGTRGGVLETTFAEETETDLFGEQAVLCGGTSELVLKGFETLVEAGYQPEVAYYECLHELKLIVDLLHEGGLTKMHKFISDTAKYGDLTRGPRIVNDKTKKEMGKILKEIQKGKFAKQWIAENAGGRKNTTGSCRRTSITSSRRSASSCARACRGWNKVAANKPRRSRGSPHVPSRTSDDLRHDAARRRAIARLQHDAAREAAGRPRARGPRRRRHRGRLSGRLARRLREPCKRSRARCRGRSSAASRAATATTSSARPKALRAGGASAASTSSSPPARSIASSSSTWRRRRSSHAPSRA